MATLTAMHKPYPVYKPSGVEWLKDIPDHWEVAAAKRHFSIQLGKMLQNTPESPADAEVSYLKAQNVQWFQVVTEDIPTMWASLYEKSKFGIEEGDLLVCEGGEGGRCAILREQIDNCIIQNALHRVRPRGLSLNAFLQYVMSAVNAAGWFDVLNEKATIAHFTREKFDALTIPSPPPAEQRAIAAFLDRETARIDALVSKKERLVELLQEKRTALIRNTVTKGLDANAPLKDSGVEWLRDVPKHWEVAAAKRHFSIQLGKMLQNTPKSPEDAEVPYLKAQNVQWFQVVTEDIPTMWASQYEKSKFGVEQGDLLVCEGGEGGRCAILRKQIDSCIIQNALHRVRPRGRSLNVFLQYVMSAVNAAGWFDVLNEKATIAHFTKEKFDALTIPSPPPVEQRAIADFLDHETERLDNLVKKVHRAIELLRELRATLISAAVTGKIDVREEMECT